MILISNDFWHKRKMYNFDSYNVLYAVMTVLQGHIVLFTCDCRCADVTESEFFDLKKVPIFVQKCVCVCVRE